MLLSSLDQSKTYTFEDYSQWDFPERVELIDGKVYEMMSAPSPWHQEISGNIYTPLKNFLVDDPRKVYYAPIDVYLPVPAKKDTVLQPDICVVCDPAKIQKKGCFGAPDVVVEILSPGNSVKEMKLKYEVYEQAGVKEYWIVSPQNLLFILYRLKDGKFQQEPIKTLGDVVTSALFPGFTLDLTEVFKNVPAGEE